MEEQEQCAHEMPESNQVQIIEKIYEMASVIRADWSDPRTECREIWRLCDKLKTFL